MDEELDIYNELANLRPFKGSEDCLTPEEYLKLYFDLGRPETKFRNGTIQCSRDCNRSFFDLYYLTKAKFNDVTLEDVAKILINLCEDYGNTGISALFCPNIEKVVFTNFSEKGYELEDYSFFYDQDSLMTNDRDTEKYGVDNISFLDIISLSGKKRREIITIIY